MKRGPCKFWADTNGGAGDWLILSAGIALLGMVTVYEVFLAGADDVVSRINQNLAGDSAPGIAADEPSSASEDIRDDCEEPRAFDPAETVEAAEDCDEPSSPNDQKDRR